MFHFRPHRSYRFAVVSFSDFVEGLTHSRIRPFWLIERLGRRIHHAHISRRKKLATSAFLIASLLEFCGCNPVPSCERLRNATLDYLERNSLVDQCQPCLSAREFAALKDAVKPAIESPLSRSTESARTVREAVREAEPLSFYDPQAGTSSDLSESTEDLEASGLPAASLLPADLTLLRLPIPESVFFLYKNVPGRTPFGRRLSTATAFVVSIPGDDHRPLTRFLVTARHVVDPEWAHCAGPNPASIQIRLNRRSGGVGYENIPLERNHTPQFLTAGNTSDVAVIELNKQLIPNLEDYKFIDIPFAMLPTAAELETVQPEQKIVTAGLRARGMNDLSMYPELHAGVLATMPTVPIDIRCGIGASPRPLHLWFISATGPQGASGAPVYTFMNRGLNLMDHEGGGQEQETPVLLGIQSVTWPDRGLAGIIPSAVLKELIRSALSHDRQHARGITREMDVSLAASP